MAELKATIRLRRDTINNYASHGNHIPLKGEVCIVDPTSSSPWAKAKQIRIKIGDGINTFNQLQYVDQMNSSVICGYYHDGKFYADVNHTEEIVELDSVTLYIDLHTGLLYYYDGEKLCPNNAEIAKASDSKAGIMKLYQTRGQNIDGTMSQKAITDAISAIRLEVDSTNPELFRLVTPF